MVLEINSLHKNLDALATIYDNRFPIFAGIMTTSLAVIGLMEKDTHVKTRFWLLIPPILSALGAVITR